MGKKLSEMSLEELWQLFPIFLTEHQLCWTEWYKDEETRLNGILSQNGIKRISHIGSTAIGTIWAKPIIDILVEIYAGYSLTDAKDILVNSGYICMSQSEKRISLNKGYTEHGFADRVFHLHLRYAGDNDELYFRDFLNEHLQTALEYEKIKIENWKRYEHNRDEYTKAKTDFVTQYTKEAKELYGNKYC